MDAPGHSSSSFQIKIEEDEMDFVKLENLHHSIDIKEETMIVDYQPEVERKPEATENWFACEDCNYKTANKACFKKHLITHSEEKQFPCDTCEYKGHCIMEPHPSTSRRVRPTDDDFEEIMNWVEECDDLASDMDSDCDAIESDRESDSIEIQSVDDVEESESESEKDETKYLGKNKFVWTAAPNTTKGRTRRPTIITERPGLLGPANLGSATPEEMWNLLINDSILSEILRWTNLRIAKQKLKYKRQHHAALKDLDIIELKAFIGLLYYSAVFKSNHEHVNVLFATDGSGRDIFRAVMTKSRFLFLLSVLRFDDPDTRAERRKLDPAAPISFIFESFVGNCQKLYTVGECATIDEMLVRFRGRCKFKMHIPNKSCNYGIKIMALTDSTTHYFLNGYIYVGTGSDGRTLSQEEQKLSKPTQSALRLSKPIFDSNRNITADNWFTSIDLVHLLKKKGLTYVGTLRKNKKEISAEFLPNKTRPVESRLYGFTKDITLVSYVPEKQKAVLLVSSMHHSKCTDPITKQPEIVTYYNSTKGGVDALEEKCAIYCTGRRTRRWSMAIFFRILDISSVNAFVLHSACKDNSPVRRLDFMKKLALQLVKPELERRLMNNHTTQEIRLIILRILNVSPSVFAPLQDDRGKLPKRKNCYFCPIKKNRKASHGCVMCYKPICFQCSRQICRVCL